MASARRGSPERWGARTRRGNKNAEWTGRSTRRVASKLQPLAAPAAANPQAKGKHQNNSTGGSALPCHPDVTASTAPTLKNKVTVLDDVGYPVAVRIYRSRVWHRAGALLTTGRVRGTLIVVRAIASHVPSTIDRARLGSVPVGRAVVANLAGVDDAVATRPVNAEISLAPFSALSVAILVARLAGTGRSVANPAGANQRFIGFGARTGAERVPAHPGWIVANQRASDAVVG